MSEHTPTPWTWHVINDGCLIKTPTKLIGKIYKSDTEGLDAMYLVRAVNTYDALVEALRAIDDLVFRHDDNDGYDTLYAVRTTALQARRQAKESK